MKKTALSLAILIGMSTVACLPCSLENVSAMIQYQSNYTSNGELFTSASDVVEIIKEDRTYLSFANVTGMGEILSLKERPESDEKTAELIKAEKRNIHYCYIESDNSILYYNYNTGEIEKTDYDTSIKYTFDLVNKNVVFKATGEEVCTIPDSWYYTVYKDGYISRIMYMGNGLFISPSSETKLPETSSSTFSCSSYDIVKVIKENEEALYFADQTGLGRILVLAEKPATDEELISAIKEPKLNIHFCYLEKEKEMIYYNYNDNSLSKTEDQMEIKYTIDLVKRYIVDNSNNDVVLNFNESSGYLVVNEKNEKKEMILVGSNFISPAGYIPGESSENILGDINGDGVVDLTDLTELSLYLLHDKDFTDNQLKVADVDGDGDIHLTDLARMRQYISHGIDSF